MAVALPDAFGSQGLVFAGVFVASFIGRNIFLVIALRATTAAQHPAGTVLVRRGRRAVDRRGARARDGACGAVDTRGGRGLHGRRTPLPHAGDRPHTPVGVAERSRAPGRAVPAVLHHRARRVDPGDRLALAAPASRPTGPRRSWCRSPPPCCCGGSTSTAPGNCCPRPSPRPRPGPPRPIGVYRPPGHGGRRRRHRRRRRTRHRPPVRAHQPAWIAVILGGPALFLVGRAGFEYPVFTRVSRDRPIGLLVLAALTPAMLLVPPLLAALAATAVLAGIAVADAARARGRPAESSR